MPLIQHHNTASQQNLLLPCFNLPLSNYSLSLSLFNRSFWFLSLQLMAFVTATSSLQLRLAFNAANCRRFPVYLRSRPLKLNPGVRIFCVAQRGNGPERVSGAGSDPKGDGFSGWSESEGREQPNNGSEKKESYGGDYSS